MNTTLLFAELLLVGVQATVWIGLFLVALAERRVAAAVELAADVPPVLLGVIFVTFCYTVGVVVDRIADFCFYLVNPVKLLQRFKPLRGLDRMALSLKQDDSRILVAVRENKAHEVLNYFRSRIRVLRGSAFNLFLIGFGLFAVAAAGPSAATRLFGDLVVWLALFHLPLGLVCFIATGALEMGYSVRSAAVLAAMASLKVGGGQEKG